MSYMRVPDLASCNICYRKLSFAEKRESLYCKGCLDNIETQAMLLSNLVAAIIDEDESPKDDVVN